MWILPRIMMSVLGAASATALATAVGSYLLMSDKAVVGPLSIAQAVLSISFYNALMIAIIIGIPLFSWLRRRRRLTWWPVTWTTFVAGLVLVPLYFAAIYGDRHMLLAVLAPWLLIGAYSWFYFLLSPLAGLTALLVWKTFPANPLWHESQEPAA